MKRMFQASFWELSAVYAAGAYAIGDGVCLWGCVQHSLPVMVVGAAITGYWCARALECLACGLAVWWQGKTPEASV
jgi:hypothetical protein